MRPDSMPRGAVAGDRSRQDEFSDGLVAELLFGM